MFELRYVAFLRSLQNKCHFKLRQFGAVQLQSKNDDKILLLRGWTFSKILFFFKILLPLTRKRENLLRLMDCM